MDERQARTMRRAETFMKNRSYANIGAGLSALLLGALTGCVGYGDGPRQRGSYVEPPPDYVGATIMVEDDYMYYPRYQVYYSSYRREYVYKDGAAWVARAAPPRVSVEVLRAAPAVRLDFHDSPSRHHATVVQKYPKKWAPPGAGQPRGEDSREPGKAKDRGDRK